MRTKSTSRITRALASGSIPTERTNVISELSQKFEVSVRVADPPVNLPHMRTKYVYMFMFKATLYQPSKWCRECIFEQNDQISLTCPKRNVSEKYQPITIR